MFLAWPALAEGTQSVVSAVECSGQLSVRLSLRDELLSSPLRLESCEGGFVTLLEYATDLSEHGLVQGPLASDPTSDCGVVPLPPAQYTHNARVEPDGELAFRPLGASEPRPGALASFKTRQLCPCRPLRRTGVVEVGYASSYQVEHDGGGGAWIFGISQDRIDIHRSFDLSSATAIHTSSVAFDPNPTDRDPGSVIKDVARGARDDLYLGGDLGRIYRFSEAEGWAHVLTTPSQSAVSRLAVSQDEGPIELFALLASSELWRYAQGQWFSYGLLFEESTRSSQRPGLVWLERGRAAGMPD